MLTSIQVLNLFIMPSASNAPQPATPPNIPQPSTQQGGAQMVNGSVEDGGRTDTSAAQGSQNSAGSNSDRMPSYGLGDLLRNSNDTRTGGGA
jgi:hypothetical protein